MASYKVTVEQAGDGTWTSAIIGEDIVLGTGATKDEAVESLCSGLSLMLDVTSPPLVILTIGEQTIDA